MLCVCFFLIFMFCSFFFLGGDVLELFQMGSSTAFFVRAKTSRHFSGAPVYISLIFFFFFCYNNNYYLYLVWFLVLQREKKMFSKRKHVIWRWENLRKALICKQIRTKHDYAEPLWRSCRLLKMAAPPATEEKKVDENGRGEGARTKTRPSMLCIWTMRSSQPAHAATFKGKKNKNGGKCLSDRSMYKVYICFTSFYLIKPLVSSQGAASRNGAAARRNDKQMCTDFSTNNCRRIFVFHLLLTDVAFISRSFVHHRFFPSSRRVYFFVSPWPFFFVAPSAAASYSITSVSVGLRLIPLLQRRKNEHLGAIKTVFYIRTSFLYDRGMGLHQSPAAFMWCFT